MHVFIGPSLDPVFARARFDATFLPPARRGDLIRAVKEGAKQIVLIDGYIVENYPPSPQEVASILASGVPVWGAASLGALRAVELSNLGMKGIGWVYRAYKNKVVESDDEVVVSMDHTDFRSLTIPLVNVRYALQRLVAVGKINKMRASSIVVALRKVPFYKRDRECILELAIRSGIPRGVAQCIFDKKFDIKFRDAMQCLMHAERYCRASEG